MVGSPKRRRGLNTWSLLQWQCLQGGIREGTELESSVQNCTNPSRFLPNVVGVTTLGSVGVGWFCWVRPDSSSSLCRLRERHQDVLRQKLYKLKQEQGVESEPLFPIIKRELSFPSDRYAASGSAAIRVPPVGHPGQKMQPCAPVLPYTDLS